MEWVEIKGKGRLSAFTCIAIGPPFMIKEGYDRKHPYVCGVVELEEGVGVVARIEGVDGTKPETIKIGTPVRIEFLHRGEGKDSRPSWRSGLLACMEATGCDLAWLGYRSG